MMVLLLLPSTHRHRQHRARVMPYMTFGKGVGEITALNMAGTRGKRPIDDMSRHKRSSIADVAGGETSKSKL